MRVDVNSVTSDLLIKYVLTVSLKDLCLRKRLLSESDITLRKAIQAGQAGEQTKKQAEELATSETPEIDISFLTRTHKNGDRTHSQSNLNE